MNEPGTRELDRAATPGSSVACPLKGGAQIGNGRCVEWQVANGCHCGNALVALRCEEERLLVHPDPVSREEQRSTGVPSAQRVWQQQQQLQEVRQLIARAEQIEKARPAPEPAKEDHVPRGVRSDGAKCANEGCGNPLSTRQKPGDTCGPCNRKGKSASATHATKPRKANGGGHRMRAPEPATGDVVGILKSQLAHHQEQAAKIAKALEVLS